MIDKISVRTEQRIQMIDITSEIKKLVKKHDAKNVIVHVFCPHTTAAVTINENNDPSVQTDISETLSRIIPHHVKYSHTEGNADAHIKAAVMGSSRTIFIHEGSMNLGTWQGIFFCEFDGPRTRELWIKIIKD